VLLNSLMIQIRMFNDISIEILSTEYVLRMRENGCVRMYFDNINKAVFSRAVMEPGAYAYNV
jgi:hypothetical protein